MKTTTKANLDDLLKSEPRLAAIVGLVEINQTLRENLHQIWDFSGDLDYLNKAAATAAEFAEDGKGLDASIGALRDMVLWELDEGSGYHDWVCDVADTFILKKERTAIVDALAGYIQEKDCRRMYRLYMHDRAMVVQKINEGTLDTAEQALRQAPEAASGFLKNMIRWFDWSTRAPVILTDFTSMAESYAPIKGAVKAFVDYKYEPHTSNLWGAQYQRFIHYLADDKTVECLRHFAGYQSAISGFIKAIDIASINPKNVPRYLAVAESCKDIPFILEEATDKLLKCRHSGEGSFDWDKMPKVLARKSVKNAASLLKDQETLRKSMVSYVMGASIRGTDKDVDTVANAYVRDDVVLAYDNAGEKLQSQFTDTLGIIALRTKNSEVASNFTSYVKKYVGQPEALEQSMSTLGQIAMHSESAATVNETLRLIGSYNSNQDLSNLVQAALIRFAQDEQKSRIAVLVNAYNDPKVKGSLELHYSQYPLTQEEDSDDKRSPVERLIGSVASLASESLYGDTNLIPELARVSTLLAGNQEQLKSFYWAFHHLASAKDNNVLSTYLQFVEQHHQSGSLKSAMDYFRHGYFERRNQLKPVDIVNMIKGYPMP